MYICFRKLLSKIKNVQDFFEEFRKNYQNIHHASSYNLEHCSHKNTQPTARGANTTALLYFHELFSVFFLQRIFCKIREKKKKLSA